MIQILINSYRIFISITDNRRKQNYNILHKKKVESNLPGKRREKIKFRHHEDRLKLYRQWNDKRKNYPSFAINWTRLK